MVIQVGEAIQGHLIISDKALLQLKYKSFSCR
jgi:hypothetical protein